MYAYVVVWSYLDAEGRCHLEMGILDAKNKEQSVECFRHQNKNLGRSNFSLIMARQIPLSVMLGDSTVLDTIKQQLEKAIEKVEQKQI